MNLPTYTSGLLFTTAHKAVRVRVYSLLEKYNLNPSYWSILGATMHAPEGLRLTTVAAKMGVKAPMVTMLANDLITMGLITRTPHQSDGRAKLLRMTEKGSLLAAKVESELNAEISHLMQGVSAAEAATFKKILETIIRNAA